MADKKSQEELEKPVKVYQLDAVETKVDQSLKLLETVVKQTSSLVTLEQMTQANEVLKTYIDTKVKDAEKKTQDVDEKYKPLKNKSNTITGILTSAVVLQLIYIIFNLFGGKG